MKTYDAIIIGAGQAGGPLSHYLADQGWTVALVEREYLGGTCINFGCTPTKKMIASARVAHMAHRAAEYGVNTGEVRVDLAQVVALKDELVKDFRAGQQRRIDERPNIHLFCGEASFTGPYTIQVNGESLTSRNIFINTGTRPRIPSVEGVQDVNYLTSRTILDLKELPRHLLVIGGSYVALEFGQMFQRFGSQVTIVERSGQLVPHEDRDVADALQEALQAEGMQILCSASAKRVAQDPAGDLELTLESKLDGRQFTVTGSHLLLASGRSPNTAALNLPAAGIDMDEKGYIPVNEYLETNVPGIYAMGDVKGGPAFTHISYNDFQIISHNLFNAEKQSVRGRIVPYALYTDPELGRVGLSEREAREAGYEIKVGQIPMSQVSRAIERNETQGMMKVVIDARTNCILGAAVLSVEGGELVQSLMALMLANAPWTVFHNAVFIHPTLSEGFFSLMNTVR